MKKIVVLIFAVLAAVTIFTSCNEEGNSSPSSERELKSGEVLSMESLADNKISLRFSPTNNKSLPRIADIYIKFDNSALKLKNYKKGEALEEAEKDLFVKSDDSTGLIRITSLSPANLNRIGEGVIATLEFEKLSEGETVVEFDNERQVFAPAEANNQVTFGKALTL